MSIDKRDFWHLQEKLLFSSAKFPPAGAKNTKYY